MQFAGSVNGRSVVAGDSTEHTLRCCRCTDACGVSVCFSLFFVGIGGLPEGATPAGGVDEFVGAERKKEEYRLTFLLKKDLGGNLKNGITLVAANPGLGLIGGDRQDVF